MACSPTLDPFGSTAVTANGINDLGQIVGFYTDANGNTIGFENNGSRAVDLGDDAPRLRGAGFPWLSQGTSGDAGGRLSFLFQRC